MPEKEIPDSLKFLSRILYTCFGQKVILLIDEYDVPLDKAFQHGYYEEMVSLIRGLFGQALKTNEFLQFAVLTGRLRVSKESIFTKAYHGMVLGLLRSQENWLIQSNAETGEGYSDISICTPARTGIVIELKYANGGDLEAACTKALRQIEEKKYAVGLQRRGMKNIIRYGMAFWEKECMVILAPSY